MNGDDLHELCLSFPGASHDFPFGPETVVYRVAGKLFALSPVDSEPLRVNLKCDPLLAEQLRDEFPTAVLPGWHMNKRHWNTVVDDGTIDDDLIVTMVEDSYDLIVDSLPRSQRPAG
ncbi:MAG: MmcQ/YjbR family DNA-binding protein [Thermoleophilia bacterium]|nr:MmcQ/YjbR family DNA-binding protein [Thermoleophilia bacterium]